MAAEVSVNLLLQLTGLDKDISVPQRGTDGTAPTSTTGLATRTLAVADTAEALDLGGVTTVQGILIWTNDYDLDIDTSFVAAFNAEQTVEAGELPVLIVNPGGTVYVNGNVNTETPSYTYIVWGT